MPWPPRAESFLAPKKLNFLHLANTDPSYSLGRVRWAPITTFHEPPTNARYFVDKVEANEFIEDV